MIISGIVVFFWWTLKSGFAPSWHVIADITPWALTFYCITLIGATMNDLWGDYQKRPELFVGLLLTAAGVIVYYSLIVILRHEPSFVPGTAAYVATFILLAVSIGLCYRAAK
jgi:uncharacterized membrane protein